MIVMANLGAGLAVALGERRVLAELLLHCLRVALAHVLPAAHPHTDASTLNAAASRGAASCLVLLWQ